MSELRQDPLNRVKENMLESVRENFIRDGEVVPVAILYYPNGQGEVIATELRDEKAKTAFVTFLRKHCRDKQPLAMMLVTEAHMLIVASKEEEERIRGKEIKDVEGATDVIVCSFETKLTSEVIIMEVMSVGGKNIIVREKRKGTVLSGNFKDILATPIGLN